MTYNQQDIIFRHSSQLNLLCQHRDLYIKQGIRSKVNHVVYAGANNSIFNKENFLYWDKNEKIKLVTHHWGANWNKGFNSYNKIDQLLGTAKWKNRLAFTYIGNVHKKANFENSKIHDFERFMSKIFLLFFLSQHC